MIAPESTVEVAPLGIDTINSELFRINFGGQEFDGRVYSYGDPDINFAIYYSLDYRNVLFNIYDTWLIWENPDYVRMYPESYLDGLYHQAFTNYLIHTSSREYLICRTFPAHNEVLALHTLYFVIELTDKNNLKLNLLGSYGYCDNGIGDFNEDGILDMILLTQDSIVNPPLNPDHPEGIFKASIFSVSDGKVSPVEIAGEPIECSFRTANDTIAVMSGNWPKRFPIGND